MVRLFVSSSHLCTLYMVLYARNTNQGQYKDVLVLDSPPKKGALIKVITDTKTIYPWAEIINLSTEIADSVDFLPNTRKTITRKLKNKFPVKYAYNFLLNIYLKRQQKNETKIITNKLSGLGDVTELNILTQTTINQTLFKLYPKAHTNYFEHGLGDYVFVQQKTKAFNFYCVFADTFKTYLQQKKQELGYVKALPDLTDFPALAQEVIDKVDGNEEIKSYLHIEGKLVLILMESMQFFYNVPDTFWVDSLALFIAQVDKPEEYTFILKPHPTQSVKSIEISKDYMINTRKLKTRVLEHNYSINYSVEVLYTLWQHNTCYVFSIFSSASYYISKLYSNKTTQHFYAYNFFEPYINNAPAQFSAYFKGLEDLIRKVFSENCTDISVKK